MNIIEAVKKAMSGQAIMSVERNEWIICSGGLLRWKSNRQAVTLTPRDIMCDKWICEDDLITISKIQLDESFSVLRFEIDSDGDIAVSNKDEFFKFIYGVSHTNKSRHKEDV